MKIYKLRPALGMLLFYSSLFSTGCATLPNASEIIGEIPADGKPPRILSIKGLLTTRQSKSLFDRLKREAGPTDLLERQIAVNEAISGSPLVKGNKIKLLVDGPATFAAMFEAIGNARSSINMETFIFEYDDTGKKLAELLVKKRGEGVQVNLIYDSVGSLGTPSTFFQNLRDRGINVVEFNPINPFKSKKKYRLTMRDHRKILVVDGKLAITGGVNISHVYSSKFFGKNGDKTELPWRDTDLLIEGPAAVELQKVFFKAWTKQQGPDISQKDYFPPPREAGKDLVQVVASSPGELGRTTFIMYISAISFAEKSIHLTSSYFVPDRQTVKVLCEAAKSGVDVKIIVPDKSDEPLALYAGRYYYDELLEEGVKLYRRRNAVLHAKTAVIDGVWSTVGSTNMDFLSFYKNFEVNTVVLGSDFASDLKQIFARDLEESEPILLEKWEKRSWSSRIREWWAHLFIHFL